MANSCYCSMSTVKIFVFFGLFLFLAGCVGNIPTSLNETTPEEKESLPSQPTASNKELPLSTSENSKFMVTYVVDGDTLELNTADRVRLICIDTPEKGEYYYPEAKDYLVDLTLNEKVTLIKDISETDKYGRLLRYVYVGDKFVNYELVEKSKLTLCKMEVFKVF